MQSYASAGIRCRVTLSEVLSRWYHPNVLIIFMTNSRAGLRLRVVLMVGYNRWRKFCGLQTANSFDKMVDIADPAVRRRFRTLYRQIAICCFHRRIVHKFL